ncbi:MAG: glycoside hydrolase family 25 protein [Bacteroidaceae bacterium]|nr:glycoside hydrolase family 25 protein [Bacteroidaceae bacterium]
MRWKARYGNVDLPKGYSIHGIDISHHQGVIDWEDLSNASLGGGPVAFIMMKATEGQTLLDDCFNDNFYQAGQWRYIRGVYHFFTPEAGTGKKQAQYYLRQVHLEDGDLPPILDIEQLGKLTRKQIRQEAKAWLDECEKAYGRTPIIYTYYKFKEQYLDGEEFDKYPYWIAHYYVKELGYKGEWKFWQHTDCGKLPGIKGDVDLDVYNGSMYDLRKQCLNNDEETDD